MSKYDWGDGKPFSKHSSITVNGGWDYGDAKHNPERCKPMEGNINEPFFITVTRCNLNNPDELPEHHKIDFHSNSARNWLQKHQWWSLHNGYSVTLASCKADDP